MMCNDYVCYFLQVVFFFWVHPWAPQCWGQRILNQRLKFQKCMRNICSITRLWSHVEFLSVVTKTLYYRYVRRGDLQVSEPTKQNDLVNLKSSKPAFKPQGQQASPWNRILKNSSSHQKIQQEKLTKKNFPNKWLPETTARHMFFTRPVALMASLEFK